MHHYLKRVARLDGLFSNVLTVIYTKNTLISSNELLTKADSLVGFLRMIKTQATQRTNDYP